METKKNSKSSEIIKSATKSVSNQNKGKSQAQGKTIKSDFKSFGFYCMMESGDMIYKELCTKNDLKEWSNIILEMLKIKP